MWFCHCERAARSNLQVVAWRLLRSARNDKDGDCFVAKRFATPRNDMRVTGQRNTMTNTETIYQYPFAARRITTALWIFVLVFNFVEYALAWMRVIYSLLLTPLQLPYIDFLAPSPNITLTLLIAHLGLFAALVAAYAIPFFTPRVTVYDTGLLMTTALGKQWIPFPSLVAIRSTELRANGRFIVWVDSKRGLPLQGLVASVLFGRWCRRGFLLTSDLPGFNNIIANLVAQLKR